MRTPSDRLLVASRRRVDVAAKPFLLQGVAERIAVQIGIPEMLQRATVSELLVAGRKKIIGRHLPLSEWINRAACHAFIAERKPRKIDGRQPAGGDVVGQRLMVNAGNNPMPIPAFRDAKSFVATPRFDMNQPIADFLRVPTDSLNQARPPRGRGIDQQANATALDHAG